MADDSIVTVPSDNGESEFNRIFGIYPEGDPRNNIDTSAASADRASGTPSDVAKPSNVVKSDYDGLSAASFATTPAAQHVVSAGKGSIQVAMEDGSVVERTGSRNWRNNNPGNIEYGKFARASGAVGTDGRFAVFPTYQAGQVAQAKLLFEVPAYANQTVAGAITKWAPPKENDTANYIKQVATKAGVDPSDKMSDIPPQKRMLFLKAMEQVEGLKPGTETKL